MKHAALIMAALLMGLLPPASYAQRILPPKIEQPDGQEGEKRVALVIGNKDYKHLNDLENTANDADSISAVLRRKGFTVIKGIDVSRDSMDIMFDAFKEKLGTESIALFYYAGHGFGDGSDNYLIPVDAPFDSLESFSSNTLNLLREIEEQDSKFTMVFLDACRNFISVPDTTIRRVNYIQGLNNNQNRPANMIVNRTYMLAAAPDMQPKPSTGWSVMVGKGGALISYATAPGEYASDNTEGSNGLFTEALLEYINEKGLEVTEMLRQVGAAVQEKSDGAASPQRPWLSLSYRGSFYFTPATNSQWRYLINSTAVAPVRDMQQQKAGNNE